MSTTNPTRRQFILSSMLAGGGLALAGGQLGWTVPGIMRAVGAPHKPAETAR